MSAYGIMMGMAAAIGQFSGGALIQWNPADLGWRAIFLLTLPVCAVTLLLGWKVVPETGGGGDVRLDLGGAALISLTLAAIVVPLSEGREQGWPAWVFASLACVPFLTAAFFRYEARLSRTGGMPLVDMALLRIPSFRRGVLVATLFFFTTSFYLLFGLYQQEGRGMAPLQVGLAIVPYGVGLFIGPLISAPLVRLRPKLLSIGMGIQVTFYTLVGLLVALGIDGMAADGGGFPGRPGPGNRLPPPVRHGAGRRAPGAGRASRPASPTPRCRSARRSASPRSAACSSWFWAMRTGERAYAHAFSIAQWTATAGLFLAMLLGIPPRRRMSAVAH